MTPEDFRLLNAYNSWANHRVLEACAALTPEQFQQDLGSSFASVRDTLVHICGAEWLWLERWNGRSPSALLWPEHYPRLEDLRQRWAQVEKELTKFVAGTSQHSLDKVIEHRTTKGVPQAQLLWQMLQHLYNHGSYHRGQVSAMLRQLGAQPQATDLILFYRERAAGAGVSG